MVAHIGGLWHETCSKNWSLKGKLFDLFEPGHRVVYETCSCWWVDVKVSAFRIRSLSEELTNKFVPSLFLYHGLLLVLQGLIVICEIALFRNFVVSQFRKLL